MKDPIAEIILDYAVDFRDSCESSETTVKQIRQQIGRELLYRIPPDDEFTMKEIREVCKLD